MCTVPYVLGDITRTIDAGKVINRLPFAKKKKKKTDKSVSKLLVFSMRVVDIEWYHTDRNELSKLLHQPDERNKLATVGPETNSWLSGLTSTDPVESPTEYLGIRCTINWTIDW